MHPIMVSTTWLHFLNPSSSLLCTLTFCLYSSTMASISVELSVSVIICRSMHSMSDVGWSDKILDSASGAFTITRGDCGSPSSSHSLSSSSSCCIFLSLDLDVGIAMAFGLLKHHILRLDDVPGFWLESKRLYAKDASSNFREKKNQNFSTYSTTPWFLCVKSYLSYFPCTWFDTVNTVDKMLAKFQNTNDWLPWCILNFPMDTQTPT